MNLVGSLISLFFGYILAAMFTASVSMTPALTAWGSLWTYAAWLGFTMVGGIVLFIVVMLAASLLGAFR